MICKSNNNYYHDGASAFFGVFSEKDSHEPNAVERAITNSTGAGKFEITDTKPRNPVVSLLNQENVELLEQLNSGFEKNNQQE